MKCENLSASEDANQAKSDQKFFFLIIIQASINYFYNNLLKCGNVESFEDANQVKANQNFCQNS